MKKVVFALSIIFTLLLFQYCSSSYSVTSQYDKFEDIKLFSMEGNKLGVKGLSASLAKAAVSSLGGKTMDIYLNAQKFSKKGVESFRLQVSYKGAIELGVWLNTNGESLVLLVDGNRMGFKFMGEPKSPDIESDMKNLRYIYSETLIYPITLEQLKIISYAKIVEVKLSGQSQYYQTVFDDDNFENLKQFLSEHAK